MEKDFETYNVLPWILPAGDECCTKLPFPLAPPPMRPRVARFSPAGSGRFCVSVAEPTSDEVEFITTRTG